MSPFDKARYERLLEGLEATEICYAEALQADSAFRIDSEFFRRTILRAKAQFERQRKVHRLAEISPSIEHPIEVTRAYSDDGGHRVLLAQEVRSNILMLGEGSYLDSPIAAFLKKNRLGVGDIVLTRTGANFGQCAPVLSEATLFACADLLILRKGSLPAEYISTVLNTSQGRLILDRGAYGMAQPHIAPTYLNGIPIPVFDQLVEPVRNAVRLATHERDAGLAALSRAENMLLHALGLDTWTPPEALSYVRSSREAFASGRLDAEHFQPRFAALAAKLAAIGNSERLGDQLLFNARGRQPEYADEGLPVINSKHVLRNEVRYDDDNRRAVFDDDSLLIETGDVLINGTGVGTIGRAAAYLHQSPALPDNHVTILRPNSKLDPVYLAVFLNSMAGQLQVDQRLRGSSGQIELYPADIAEFQIWVAPKPLQLDIRRQVEQSFAQRQRANQLLDAARRAVEIAVEDSEAAARAYLEEKNSR